MAYIAIILMIFVGELFIKGTVERFVPFGEKKPFLFGKLFLTKSHNEGAAYNFMEKKRGLVALLSVMLTCVCGIYFAITLTKSGKEGLKLSLALLLGGAFSNTYDRLKRKYVVDYFGFSSKKKKKNEIIYNLSDFCIVTGAMLSAILSAGK